MTDDLATSLRAAEHRLQAAQLTSDVAALTELIDPEVRYTGPDGAVATREDDLAAHRGGTQVLDRLDEIDLAVRVVGTTGVTWALVDLAGQAGGTPFAAQVRYTRTWTHDGSAWRVLAAHAGVVAG